MSDIHPSNTDQLVGTLKKIAGLKQDVYDCTLSNFKIFKKILSDVIQELKDKMTVIDERVELSFKELGDFEAQIKFGGDTLIFSMHTNIFNFDETHQVKQLQYVKDDQSNGYCGLINIYNFLTDSFKYKRSYDIGYLFARIFINKDCHFFVEGKRQLGFLYNDFENAVLNDVYIKSIVETSMIHAIEFDLLVPPYEDVKQLTVQQKIDQSGMAAIITGKRVGYQFTYDSQELTDKDD